MHKWAFSEILALLYLSTSTKIRVLSFCTISGHSMKLQNPLRKKFANCPLQDIEWRYIEDDPSATINTVPLDDTLDIKGKHTESNSPLKGLVAFDIIFDAIAPSSGELIKLIINLKPYKNKGIFVGVVQIMGIVSNSEHFAPYERRWLTNKLFFTLKWSIIKDIKIFTDMKRSDFTCFKEDNDWWLKI